MPQTSVQRGNILLQYTMAVTLTPAVVASVTAAEQTFTIYGLQVGDAVEVTPNFAYTALAPIGAARVSAANTLAISFLNGTQTATTPNSGQYVVQLYRPEALPLPVNVG